MGDMCVSVSLGLTAKTCVARTASCRCDSTFAATALARRPGCRMATELLWMVPRQMPAVFLRGSHWQTHGASRFSFSATSLVWMGSARHVDARAVVVSAHLAAQHRTAKSRLSASPVAPAHLRRIAMPVGIERMPCAAGAMRASGFHVRCAGRLVGPDTFQSWAWGLVGTESSRCVFVRSAWRRRRPRGSVLRIVRGRSIRPREGERRVGRNIVDLGP